MKRFYKEVDIRGGADAFEITLDGRALRTPSKTSMALPTKALAEVVAAEWRAQGEEIVPQSMPATRLANAAIDRVAPRVQEVVRELAAFGDTDLLYYRTHTQDALADRQRKQWDPFLNTMSEKLGISFALAAGIMPVRQNEKTLAVLHGEVAALAPFSLAAFHQLVTGLGSLILALVLRYDLADLETVFAASQLDNLFQEQEWGVDAEAQEARAELQRDISAAYAFFRAVTA